MANDPFSLSDLFQSVENDKLNRLIWSPVERILGFRKLSKLYQSLYNKSSPLVFIKAILERLEISYVVKPSTKHVLIIPDTKPLLIVSNHPFGAIEALVLVDYLSNHRSDIRIMANLFLKRIAPISNLLLGVNPFKDNLAKNSNRIIMRKIYQWLQTNHCLISFPAGNVSHLQIKKPFIADGHWDPQIARLARLTKSDVLPVYIEGKNSLLFYLLGPHWHALMYGRELLNKKGKCITIKTADLITKEEIHLIKNDQELIDLFRKKTDDLALRP